MSVSTKPATKPTTTKNGKKSVKDEPKVKAARQQFFAATLTMSWQLAIVVLVPLLVGSWLDSHLQTTPACTFVGFLLAMVGTAVVVWNQLKKFTPPAEDDK